MFTFRARYEPRTNGSSNCDCRVHGMDWQVAANMVAATLDIYNTIADNLLPTPAKSHYTFNLRDLSKVFQVRRFHSYILGKFVV